MFTLLRNGLAQSYRRGKSHPCRCCLLTVNDVKGGDLTWTEFAPHYSVFTSLSLWVRPSLKTSSEAETDGKCHTARRTRALLSPWTLSVNDNSDILHTLPRKYHTFRCWITLYFMLGIHLMQHFESSLFTWKRNTKTENMLVAVKIRCNSADLLCDRWGMDLCSLYRTVAIIDHDSSLNSQLTFSSWKWCKLSLTLLFLHQFLWVRKIREKKRCSKDVAGFSALAFLSGSEFCLCYGYSLVNQM